MKLPDTPQPGSSFLPAVWYRQVVDYLRRLNDRVRALEGALPVAPGRRRVRAAGHPFRVVNASEDSDIKVQVTFGMVNSVVPEIGGTPINATTPPTIAITASGYIILAANTDDDGEIDTAVINYAAEIPEDTEDRGHIVLAYVTRTAGSGGLPPSIRISQSVTHSLQHQMCGEAVHNFWGV